jgi:hypothetical protein
MPTFSFDESEFAEVSETPEGDAADEALASLEESPAPEDQEEDAELADVDLRLATADYYRAILRHEFFAVQGQAAKIVDREIRSFIRERLEILLGLRGPRPADIEPLFSESEVQALKLLAGKVLSKPGLINEEPTVKKMATPVPSSRPEVRAAPQVKKIPAPPPAPSTKPRNKPGPKPGFKRNPPATPAPAVKATPVKKPANSQTYVNHEGQEVTLVEGETIEENGRRYLIASNDHGTLYRKDITGQVAPKNRLPPMTPHQMSIMSQQHAEAQLASLDETTGLAIVASLQRE